MDDLSSFFKAGGVSNLDWLDVNEADYRKLDTLPKQNLDIAPDLMAAWSHEDKPASRYVPNRDMAPRTMGDLSKEHGLLRTSPDDIRQTARLAMMISPDPVRLRHALSSRYDAQAIQAAKTALTEVFAERGLLGPFYIDAADFPGCASGSSKAAAFVRQHAPAARFLVAKKECQGCIHAKPGPTAGKACAVFHKELQVEVPYTDALARQVEQTEAAHGKAITASTLAPKERIRLALLAPKAAQTAPAQFRPQENVQRLLKAEDEAAPLVVAQDLTRLRDTTKAIIAEALESSRLAVTAAQDAYRRVASARTAEQIDAVAQSVGSATLLTPAAYTGSGQAMPVRTMGAGEAQTQLIAAGNLTRKRDEAAQLQASEVKARPIVAVLRREMLKGRTENELVEALRVTASALDLEATRSHWEPLLREAGLFGVIYSTQTAFNDCHNGASFLATHNPGVKAIVAGQKCTGCIYNKIGRCLVYGKPLAKTAADLYTPALVEQVFQEHKQAGRIAPWDTRLAQAPTPREALQTLHRASSAQNTVAAPRETVFKAFTGTDVGHATRSDLRQEIVTAARRYLNEGLYGQDLGRALKARFDPRDIRAAGPDLKASLAEQGLQGIYFVDPSVYEDYGRGCKEAARLHRTRQVPYVKFASKCAGCVHQHQAGICSVLNKPVVVNVPYPQDKVALQRQMLASGSSTSTSPMDLVNNGMTMMAEYDLGGRGLDVELDRQAAVEDLAVSFGDAGIEL